MALQLTESIQMKANTECNRTKLSNLRRTTIYKCAFFAKITTLRRYSIDGEFVYWHFPQIADFLLNEFAWVTLFVLPKHVRMHGETTCTKQLRYSNGRFQMKQSVSFKFGKVSRFKLLAKKKSEHE